MFNFLKKKEENKLYSPVKGKTIAIENVKDETFAKKILGEGIAFEISDDAICSPCDGKIELITETSHAFMIKSENGTQIMIHIGLNTVSLKGRGFTRECSEGQKVKKGDTIIRVDRQLMKRNDIDLTTIMIITDDNGFVPKISETDREVVVGDMVISME